MHVNDDWVNFCYTTRSCLATDNTFNNRLRYISDTVCTSTMIEWTSAARHAAVWPQITHLITDCVTLVILYARQGWLSELLLHDTLLYNTFNNRLRYISDTVCTSRMIEWTSAARHAAVWPQITHLITDFITLVILYARQRWLSELLLHDTQLSGHR